MGSYGYDDLRAPAIQLFPSAASYIFICRPSLFSLPRLLLEPKQSCTQKGKQPTVAKFFIAFAGRDYHPVEQDNQCPLIIIL